MTNPAEMTDTEAAEILEKIDHAVAFFTPELREAQRHAAKRLREMQWQSMESAPKDRTWILLWNRHDESAEVWAYDKTDWVTPDGNTWGTSDPKCDPDYLPTHWMPLPQPPEAE